MNFLIFWQIHNALQMWPWLRKSHRGLLEQCCPLTAVILLPMPEVLFPAAISFFLESFSVANFKLRELLLLQQFRSDFLLTNPTASDLRLEWENSHRVTLKVTCQKGSLRRETDLGEEGGKKVGNGMREVCTEATCLGVIGYFSIQKWLCF